jgi:hypothetical protein
VAVDQLAAQYAGYTAYARIQQLRGNDEEAKKFLNKAREVMSFLNDTWWDEDEKRYYSHLNSEYDLVHNGFSRYVPYYGAAGDGTKLRAVLDAMVQAATKGPEIGVEGMSHLPEILYQHGKTEAAYKVLLDLTRNRRREYPEVSFAVVGAIVTGVMGIELEVHPPNEALEWGGYVDRFITSLPALTTETSRAELTGLSIRANDISVLHEGVTKTILTNQSGPSFLWKARFPGSFDMLLANGEPVEANREELFPGGPEISWVGITVGAGETLTARVPN